jgi:hypothetical protein
MPIPKQGVDNTKSHYYLELNDSENLESLRWFYPYRSVPTIKFQISYASASASAFSSGFMGEEGKIKSAVTEQEVAKLISASFGSRMSYYKVKKIKKHFKKAHKNSMTRSKLRRIPMHT